MCETISTAFFFSFFYYNRAKVGPSETIATPWVHAHLVLINKLNTNTHTQKERQHTGKHFCKDPPLRKSLSTSELPIQLGSTHLPLIYKCTHYWHAIGAGVLSSQCIYSHCTRLRPTKTLRCEKAEKITEKTKKKLSRRKNTWTKLQKKASEDNKYRQLTLNSHLNIWPLFTFVKVFLENIKNQNQMFFSAFFVV